MTTMPATIDNQMSAPVLWSLLKKSNILQRVRYLITRQRKLFVTLLVTLIYRTL